jgi:hypothetical protein
MAWLVNKFNKNYEEKVAESSKTMLKASLA